LGTCVRGRVRVRACVCVCARARARIVYIRADGCAVLRVLATSDVHVGIGRIA
jgi:hypothetical protein